MRFYGFRFYSPQLGRWLSRDPIGEEAFLRFYVQGKKPEERRRLRVRSQDPGYLFVRNDPIGTFDILGLDSPGCDLPDKYKKDTDNSDCYLRCCATHDACYDKHDCTKKSWCGNAVGGLPGIIVRLSSDCVRCNDAVAACFAACKLGKGPDEGKKYYCPNGPNKGTWYDDYDAIPASCWEDGKKPPKPQSYRRLSPFSRNA